MEIDGDTTITIIGTAVGVAISDEVSELIGQLGAHHQLPDQKIFTAIRTFRSNVFTCVVLVPKVT